MSGRLEGMSEDGKVTCKRKRLRPRSRSAACPCGQSALRNPVSETRYGDSPLSGRLHRRSPSVRRPSSSTTIDKLEELGRGRVSDYRAQVEERREPLAADEAAKHREMRGRKLVDRGHSQQLFMNARATELVFDLSSSLESAHTRVARHVWRT